MVRCTPQGKGMFCPLTEARRSVLTSTKSSGSAPLKAASVSHQKVAQMHCWSWRKLQDRRTKTATRSFHSLISLRQDPLPSGQPHTPTPAPCPTRDLILVRSHTCLRAPLHLAGVAGHPPPDRLSPYLLTLGPNLAIQWRSTLRSSPHGTHFLSQKHSLRLVRRRPSRYQ